MSRLCVALSLHGLEIIAKHKAKEAGKKAEREERKKVINESLKQ